MFNDMADCHNMCSVPIAMPTAIRLATALHKCGDVVCSACACDREL